MGTLDGRVIQMISSHRMTDAYQRPRHQVSFHVDHMKQVSRMIIPIRVIPQQLLVQDTAVALLSDVCDPYTPDAEAILL